VFLKPEWNIDSIYSQPYNLSHVKNCEH